MKEGIREVVASVVAVTAAVGVAGTYYFGKNSLEDIGKLQGQIVTAAESNIEQRIEKGLEKQLENTLGETMGKELGQTVEQKLRANFPHEPTPPQTKGAEHIGRIITGQESVLPIIPVKTSSDAVRTYESSLLAAGAGGAGLILLMRGRSGKRDRRSLAYPNTRR